MAALLFHQIPQVWIATMFAVTMPYAFSSALARSVGLGGLRAEVGAKSGRPFHTTRLDVFRHELRGGENVRSELGEYIARMGKAGQPLSIGMLIFLKAMHDTAEEKQRDVFRQHRRRQSDSRNRRQADIFRQAISTRRTRRGLSEQDA